MYTNLIEPNSLNTNLGNHNWLVVDCRFSLQDTEKGRKHYRESHIPGAIYAHLDDDLSAPIIPGKTSRHPLPSVEELTSMFSSWGIDEGTQVVAYDYKSGGIAARLWWMLRWLGHDKVAVLNGGWHAWESEGLPTGNTPSNPVPKKFIPKVREHLLVDADFVDKNRESDKELIVDSRNPERYRGEEEPIDPVAGHIPGAVNLPFMENVDEDGRFIDRSDLRNRFQNAFAHRDTSEVTFYCGSGVTACHNLLAVHYTGLGNAKLYAGSWSEWITDPNHAVESVEQEE